MVPSADRGAKLPAKEDERTPISQRLMIARVVGKSCLGLGFIVAILGVTNGLPAVTRSGLALLLIGIAATVVSFVHAFNRRRLRRRR
ncbi:MAG: hypothetical protein AB1515_07565 [Nitrospirota bacterium]